MTYFTNNTKQRSNHTHTKKALCWLNAVQRAVISSREKAVKVTNHTQRILPPSFSGLNTSLKTNKADYEEITAFKKRRNSVSEEEAFTCSAQASLQIDSLLCKASSWHMQRQEWRNRSWRCSNTLKVVTLRTMSSLCSHDLPEYHFLQIWATPHVIILSFNLYVSWI